MENKKYRRIEGINHVDFVNALDAMKNYGSVFWSIENMYKIEENLLMFYSEFDKCWKENKLSFKILFNSYWFLCEEITEPEQKFKLTPEMIKNFWTNGDGGFHLMAGLDNNISEMKEKIKRMKLRPATEKDLQDYCRKFNEEGGGK